MAREASIERNTKETQIRLKLNIDGTGRSDINTGIGFFDHMLDGFTRHGLYDLDLKVHGDLDVDDHHTIEKAKIQESFLEMPSVRQLAIKKASGVMAAVSFLWMRFWYFVQWIFPEGRILAGTQSFQQRSSVIWQRRW